MLSVFYCISHASQATRKRFPIKLCHSVLSLQHIRSNFSDAQIAAAKTWVEGLNTAKIPQSEFEITYSRASGAGGQKVNKTSSKATVALLPDKWLTDKCRWVPKPIQEQLVQRKVRYQTKQGGLLIQSDRTRNRETNTEDCFSKLVEQIRANVYFAGETTPEDLQKWLDLAEIRTERRKKDKKLNSEKKKARQKKFDW